MGVGGQHHALANLRLEKRPSTHCTGDQSGPVQKISPWDLIPGHLARSKLSVWVVSDNLEYLIIQHLTSRFSARQKEL
jgi:hypothetical protein